MSLIQPETHKYWFWNSFCSVGYNRQTKESEEFFNLLNSTGSVFKTLVLCCQTWKCAAFHPTLKLIKQRKKLHCVFDITVTPLVLNAGFLRLVLGLQRRGGLGGPVSQDHREAGGPQPPEPGGLFRQVRKPRLQRRLHAPSLPVRHRQPGHRLGRLVPVQRTGEL